MIGKSLIYRVVYKENTEYQNIVDYLIKCGYKLEDDDNCYSIYSKYEGEL